MRRARGRPFSAPFLALLLATGALLASCDRGPPALDAIRARGELKVVTLNAPTSYYFGAHGAEGLELELAGAFAEKLGVALVMYPVADVSAIKAELDAGRADIAAAALTADESWKDVGIAAKPYDSVPQIVVFRSGGKRPRSTLQLESARLAVRVGSEQERMLEKLKRTVAPQLEWLATAPRAADPVEDVSSGQADYALVDAREFSFAKHLYPKVKEGFALSEERPMQWIVRKRARDLVEAVDAFFAELRLNGRLEQIERQTSGDARKFAFLESLDFQTNLRDRFRLFKPWFEQAAEEHDVDWRLLAAIGYQESKWNPQAASGDGASGVMMLTADTAAEMGVTDRNDPRQSIFAGARYLAEVREKVPARIAEPDRTWLTVAAYNVGFGHVEDARILAQSRGKNPDSWADVREHLPLLAQERWYMQAKRGYARGWEPVQFVDRVQRYLTLLEWQPGDAVASGEATRIEAPPPGD
jgi:membrane-bound lytic murein transglycosylase F